jgi:hypothetical protein
MNIIPVDDTVISIHLEVMYSTLILTEEPSLKIISIIIK